MNILAIDPGTEQSAYCFWPLPHLAVVARAGIWSNLELLERLRNAQAMREAGRILVIEQIRSMGLEIGQSTMDTIEWCGRFREAWEGRGGTVVMLPRQEVKLHMTGRARATDKNINQAIWDRFGDGERRVCVGTKKAPGPFYGFKADMWQAVAVALTYSDQQTRERR